MTATTYPNFQSNTEGTEVAKAFAGEIRSKTILITGVNLKGIGYSTAEAFASQSPARLIIVGRDPAKLRESIDALRANFPNVDYRPLTLNLSSQKDVRTAAAELLSWTDVPALNIVVNSAGIMNLPSRTVSEDGIEMHFATNHIGHWFFACLVMPKLIEAAQNNPKGSTRIINVSSGSPSMASMRWSDLKFEKINNTLPNTEQPNYDMMRAWGMKDPETASYLPLEGYNQSKIANLLSSVAANKRLFERYGILSLTVHPGVIRTELGRNTPQEIREALAENFFKKGVIELKTLGAGASTSLVAALDPKLGDAGETRNGVENWGVFLWDCQISDKARPGNVSSKEAERLWKVSEELVGEKFAW